MLLRFFSPKDAYDVKESLTSRYFGSDGLQLTVDFARKKPYAHNHHSCATANDGYPNSGKDSRIDGLFSKPTSATSS